VVLYHDKVPDLNSCLALLPPACKSELGRAAIRVGSARREYKFGKIIMICIGIQLKLGITQPK
jgi:hypothetical protein